MTLTDFIAILPLAILVVWGVLLLLVDLWIPTHRKGVTAWLAVVGLAVSMMLSIWSSGNSRSAFGGMVEVDGFAAFLDVIFLGAGVVGIALAFDYLKRKELQRGEYYSLMLFAISGMMLMTYADDMIVVFLALEMLSIPLYIMAGFDRLHLESEEAALKYFLLGAFSSGFVLYGVALLFGATGHTDLPGIVLSVSNKTANPVLFSAGAVLLLVGFGFKSAAVPFHMWTPDVYQGSPSPVTAFMSVGAKGAGLAALLRVFILAFPSLSATLTPVVLVLAALTMLAGNVIAISQTNIKRMLAYSSIAHTGYLLMAFVPFGNRGVVHDTVAAMLFYLVAYGVATLGAWAVVIALEKPGNRGLELLDYAGLGRSRPALGIAMLICLLSFTGLPLTLGFWGKFYLFSTAVEGGFAWLAVLGVLTSLISAYYYLRVVVIMYMHAGDPQTSRDPWLTITAIASAVVLVGVAFFPNALLQLAAKAILLLQ